MRKNSKGFTLVELLAVIVIMGILMMVAIPAVTRTIENSRKDAFIDIAKAYANAVRNLWTTDAMQCGSNNSYASAMDDGDYYILIDTADSNRLSVLDQGGKSSWGNRDVKGYVRVNISTVGDKKVTKFYVALSDGTHGVYDDLGNAKEADTLVRGNILMNLSSQADILAKIETEPFTTGNVTTCSEEGGNWDITPPVSFATDSWNTIVDAVRKGNTDLYNIGDEKAITLEGYGTQIVRIVNKTFLAECSDPNFSQTACGFVLEFKNIITNAKMKSEDTNIGGWEKSEIRTFVNDTIYNSLPSELKMAIKPTKVISGHGYNDNSNNNFITTDNIYLFSPIEINISTTYDSSQSNTRTLDFYQGKSDIDRIKNLNGVAAMWWLRAVPVHYANSFNVVNHAGISNYSISNNHRGIVPAFRIG